MTGQTVVEAESVGACTLELSFDQAPRFRWLHLLWLGFLLPEGGPNYPSVIDQVPQMIQQKKLDRHS